MRKRRLNHETDTGLFADISFLLLIFFMIVTTFHKTYQLEMVLPPLVDNPRSGKIAKDRLLKIFLNEKSQLLVDNEVFDLDPTLDLSAALDRITKQKKQGMVSIHMMPTSSYADYIQLIDCLKRSKNKLKDLKAQAIYQADFAALETQNQQAINQQISFSISEKEIQ